MGLVWELTQNIKKLIIDTTCIPLNVWLAFIEYIQFSNNLLYAM